MALPGGRVVVAAGAMTMPLMTMAMMVMVMTTMVMTTLVMLADDDEGDDDGGDDDGDDDGACGSALVFKSAACFTLSFPEPAGRTGGRFKDQRGVLRVGF